MLHPFPLFSYTKAYGMSITYIVQLLFSGFFICVNYFSHILSLHQVLEICSQLVALGLQDICYFDLSVFFRSYLATFYFFSLCDKGKFFLNFCLLNCFFNIRFSFNRYFFLCVWAFESFFSPGGFRPIFQVCYAYNQAKDS